MVYRRRYFEPFVGTTETIGDKSITPDKIDEGAVTTGKIADDAVVSEKIKDDTIRTEDIKAGAVQTSDIKDGAVTEPKIADSAVSTYKIDYQAVTGSKIRDGTIGMEKLVSPPITRPITPALDTPEIGDGKVTAAKLAGDAVETVKIKDNAVTSDKIAPDSIQAGDIAANAVEGPELKDGVVGTDKLSTDAVETAKIKDGNVTTPKLANDAVETVKIKNENVTHPKLAVNAVETINIKDKNVTIPKLETDFLRKSLEGRQVFYDDFLGAVLDNRWAQSGTAGGSAEPAYRSRLQISTKLETDAVYRINWNGKLGIRTEKLPKFYVKLGDETEADENKKYIGLRQDANNSIWFSYDPGISANWRAHCVSAGVPTVVDTGFPHDWGVIHEFYIDVVSTSEVRFYIDGGLVATIYDNIPTADVEPWLEVHYVDEMLMGEVWLFIYKVVISVDPETVL